MPAGAAHTTRHPLRPLPERLRIVAGAATVVAVTAGVFAVPWTRAELEADKCRRIAPPADASQQRCLDSLEGRREWWTLGLSHRDAGSR